MKVLICGFVNKYSLPDTSCCLFYFLSLFHDRYANNLKG
jgi:hypothetical protein